jgi:hypothetical protein
MKIKRILLRLMVGAGFVFLVSLLSAQNYAQPIRLIAVADVHQLRYDQYSVREFLDVYNDDYNRTLLIESVTADSWRGHQKHKMKVNWLDVEAPVEILPGKKVRVAERKRVVSGRYGRNWWVRWLRFNVKTNWGQFNSNFVASPFKAPEKIEAEIKRDAIDSLTEPGELTPYQKQNQQTGPALLN